MSDLFGFMAMFQILIGVYALYAAFKGEGRMYKNDYPEEIKPEANKMLRIFCFVMGPVMLASGILEYLGLKWTYWVTMPIVFAGIAVYLVIFYKRFGKILKKHKNKF